MIKFGKGVVKHRVLILIVAFALLIPSGISFINTRINFDILSYLPSQIETMKGQDIMVDEFGTGALSFVILEDMKDQDIETLADDIEDLKGVNDVIWYGTIADSTLPREAIPDEVYDAFNNKDANSQLMLVTYSDTMGSDETMEAVNKMDKMVKNHCFVAGMAAVNADTKDTCYAAGSYICHHSSIAFNACHGNYNGFNNCSDVIPPKHRNGYYL